MSDRHLVLKPGNWLNAGDLIYKLATDQIPIPPNTPEKKEERRQLLIDAGIAIDPRVDDVQFHRSDITTMHIMVPPKELIKAAHDEVKSGDDDPSNDTYAIPHEYVDYALGNNQALDPLPMFFFRVGDYTLSHCR